MEEHMRSLTSEIVLREYVRESMRDGNQVIIAEGSITKALAGNAVQWIVAGAAEYGLGAVTMPAAGSGLAIGPAAETAVDAAFGAEKVLSVISAATSIYEQLGDFADAFKKAIAAYGSGDFGGYYDQLVTLTKSAVKMIGKKASEGIDKVAKKIIGAIQKIVAKIIRGINAGLKIIIPDATLGAGVATAIESAAMSLAENSYTLLEKATEKFEMFKNFLMDPSAAINFFKDLLGSVAGLLQDFSAKIKEQTKTGFGKVKVMARYGPVGGPIVLKFGPSGFQKLGEYIDKLIPTVVKVANGVLKVLMPALITAVGFLQILVKGDYKEEDEGEAGEDENLDLSQAVRGPDESSQYLSRNDIRKLISEIEQRRPPPYN